MIGEEYTVTHPYGVDTFVAEDDGRGGGEINFTEDKTPAPGTFGRALGSRVVRAVCGAAGVLLLVVVQALQWAGDHWARRLAHV